MTEEIKEILDKLKNGFCSALTYEKLLDYITNLQQLYENGLKVNQSSHKYITELEMNNAILKEDLEKANDIIEKDRQFYKCRMDEHAELKKENERLKEENKILNSNQYKAIEYIDEHTLFVNGGIIKSILKGSDNNE